MINLDSNPGVGELYNAVIGRHIGVEELCRHFLARLHGAQQAYNACIHFCDEGALAQARRLDNMSPRQLACLPLAGIPFVHKDNFCTAGVATTCASRMLESFVPGYDAFVTRRLRQSGMVMLAKTNMDEFAMGSSNETSYFGAVANPWHTDKVPGGSSGGAAVATAARLAPVATATDTGGSIRQPAALCGMTGIKPTYGRVSRFGIVAFASSFDQAGLIAPSAADIAPVLTVMSGHDAMDSTCSRRAVPNYAAELDAPLQGLRLGVPSCFFDDAVAAPVAERVRACIEVLVGLGARTVAVDLPLHSLAVAVYQILSCAECSSNLARYDGIRYGHRAEAPADLSQLYEDSRSQGFGDEVKRRVILGSFVLASGYQDRYYHQAQKLRRLISEEYLRALEQADVLIGPTTPGTAFGLGEKTRDPLQMYMSDSLTAAANLAGLPAISFNAGMADDLPVGAQLVGNYWCEERLLSIVHQYQQHTDWHRLLPPPLAS
ncbi:MAG: Asp-tRNA(Asn)/Glu-tRNA(Gln) amidotransferase subunit GatA [Proteobacteria bacterium]|nr:Asp-tRNA(Asn)/Glu-tRNA(Gln) amidotransferase subunit GatA [Pseudomonadota bacterium]